MRMRHIWIWMKGISLDHIVVSMFHFSDKPNSKMKLHGFDIPQSVTAFVIIFFWGMGELISKCWLCFLSYPMAWYKMGPIIHQLAVNCFHWCCRDGFACEVENRNRRIIKTHTRTHTHFSCGWMLKFAKITQIWFQQTHSSHQILSLEQTWNMNVSLAMFKYIVWTLF